MTATARRIDPRTVAWAPQAGPQSDLVSCPFQEILYGGARGGGKTDGVLGRVGIRAGLYGRHYSALIVRREMPQADDMLERARELWGAVAEFRQSDSSFRFSNGARARFRPLLQASDAEKFQGQNISDIVVEEAGNYPDPAPIVKLYGALRSAHGIPTSMVMTGNPGGPGQHWLAERFQILRHPGGYHVIDGKRVFIPAKVADNALLLESDPTYIDRLRMVGSAELVRAWLEGDWSAIEGAFFDCWSTTRHVVRPFVIPEHWMRFSSLDWGYARPSSVGWWAVVSDDHRVGDLTLPRGCLVRYRELYTASEPNIGMRWTAERLADEIVRLTGNEGVTYTVADPAIFAQDGGPSIAERMEGRGLYLRRADNTRVAQRGALSGWDQVRGRLVGESEDRPMLVTFSTCRDSIRTIPMLQHDAHRAEDVDTESEDHAADEWRYACASRPWTRSAPRKYDAIAEALKTPTMAQALGTLDDLTDLDERRRI